MKIFRDCKVMSLPGLEPGASGLGGSRSIQLSYRDVYDFGLA